MVKTKEHKGKRYYECELCNMYYKTQKLAQECEDFCRKYSSCNTKLIKHAVKLE